ncbi:HpcH/HpaI aldolase/citrate lyase family protein [Stakelama marina]|uniref:CoA ester lyase n=1 Tax=Stakelama marina TaxID=2826939 RepID=A0A8T4IH60_9SPHN|nr:CoA ester lyase [Stakelama marina]MBR0551629.1 CoA ester lyase [Stakelama marina]
MTTVHAIAPRTALFLPASNPRAIAKARTLEADIILLDLEDAVPAAQKEAARDAAVAAAQDGFDGKLLAIRVNGAESAEHGADIAAVANSAADFAILPKAEEAEGVKKVAAAVGKPLMVMIETPKGVLNASAIAALDGVTCLIAGTNDLRSELRIPAAAPRDGLALALQTIVLAARAGGCWALDGVFNALDDVEGLEHECVQGRAIGFDGKTLIHPGQLAVARRAFSPTPEEVEEARALVAAASDGAERFRDRMIEAMHVRQARALIDRIDTH